jgi:putative ABC transport system permease protein
MSAVGPAALRSLWAHRARYSMTLVAVILSVMFMTATLLLTGGLGRDSKGEIAAADAGISAVVRGHLVTAKDGGPGALTAGVRTPVSEATLASVRATPGVAAAAGVSSGYAQLSRSASQLLGQSSTQANVGYAWISDQRLNPFHLLSGQAPATPDAIVVDAATASKDNLHVGDHLRVVTVQGSAAVHISGIARFGNADGPLGISAVLFDETTAQQLLGQPGTYQTLVARADASNQQALVRTLQGRLGGGLDVITGAAYITEQQDAVSTATTTIQVFLTVFAIVALVIGATLIFNTFTAAVAQRSRELALLRALGATNGQVTRTVLGEAALLGIVGSALGFVLGGGAAVLLQAILGAFGLTLLTSGITYTVSSAVLALSVGLVTTTVSALIPARNAGRVPPVAALRVASVDDSASSRWRNTAGSIALAAGIGLAASGGWRHSSMLIGIGSVVALVGIFVAGPALVSAFATLMTVPLRVLGGRSGALAGRNVRRNPRRSAATANSLMLSFGIIVFFTVLAASFTQTTSGSAAVGVRSDFVVSSITTDPALLPATLAGQIAKLPEVGTSAAITTAVGTINGNQATMAGANPQTIGDVWNLGVTSGSASALGEGQVLVSQKEAAGKYSVGQSLRVSFPDGSTTQLRIGGIFANAMPGFDAPAYLLPDALISRHTTSKAALWIFVDGRPGVSLATVQRALATVLNPIPTATLQTATAWSKQGNADVDQVRNMMYALDALAILIALLGAANTMALAVHQRTRELGTLRAVGALRAQIRRMITGEALLIGVQGTVMGLLFGIGGTWALYRAANDPDLRVLSLPVVTLTGITVAGIVAAVLATAVPAWRAGRVDTLRAMASD